MRETIDADELSFVIGDDRVAERESLCCNEQIVSADRNASLFEPRTDEAVSDVGRRFERESIKSAEYGVKLSYKSPRTLFCHPVTQFCRDNDTRANPRFANLANALGDA